MVSVGDKISISKTKTGYIGSKSSNPSVGNKIGNNERGWKSGNPVVGEKIVINKDNQGRYLGWKSGSAAIMCEELNPQTINITASYHVCDAYWDSVPPSERGEVYYALNGWARDSDHAWTYGKFTDEISFDVVGGKRYWISSSNTSLANIQADDDFTIYINGVRTVLRKYLAGAGDFCTYDITDYLVSGTNTFKMFFKDWYGASFSHASIYLLELDMTNNYPEYYEFNKVVIFGEDGEYQYWSNKINVKRPTGVSVRISTNPFSGYCPCRFPAYNFPSHMLVYVNGVFVLDVSITMSAFTSIGITSYLPAGEYSDIQIMYKAGSPDSKMTAVSQAWIYFICS